MKTIARFAIDKRWYVIAGWIAFVALTQIILGGLGGSAYKDTFSSPAPRLTRSCTCWTRPGTPTRTGHPARCLHAKSGLATEPAGASAAFAGLCSEHLGWSP